MQGPSTSGVGSGPATAYRRLADRIRARLTADPQAVLAELSDGPLTCGALHAEAGAAQARFAALGLTAGDRIAVFSGSDRIVIACFVAALLSGLGIVIGDPEGRPGEVRTLIEVARPAALVLDDRIRAAIGGSDGAPPVILSARLTERETDADVLPLQAGFDAEGRPPDSAVLVFTSGTTADAKIVDLTHDNLVAQLDVFARVYGFDADSRVLNLLPLHHVDGLMRGPLIALWFGATLLRRMPFAVSAVPRLLASVADDQVTHLVTVPALLRILERIARDTPDVFRTPALRFILCSADLLDAGLWHRVEERYGVPVVNAYGLSEVVCDALFAGPDPDSRIIGTIGRPVGVTAAVVDEAGHPVPVGTVGELTIAGPTVMRGYFGAPTLTEAVLRDGVFFTGDLVRQTPDGLYTFVGRRKTAVVSAGVTIHPESITAVLAAVPGVAEAHTLGVPDRDRGERVVAVIAPEPGATVLLDRVWDCCRAEIAPERRPAEIVVVEALPRGASGKVNRAALLERLEGLAVPVPMAASVQEKSLPTEGAGASPTDRVIALAARCFNMPAAQLSEDSTPFNTPGWDSLAHIALIEAMEDTFGITVSAEDIAGLMSLGDAVAIVIRQTDAASPA